MHSKFRFVLLIGTVLLLLGAAGYAGGSVMVARDDCVSGTVLDVDTLRQNVSDEVVKNTKNFTDLSPVEQRIFLEAFTDRTEGSGVSDTYPNWADSWFDDRGMSQGSSFDITYRGDYYQLMVAHADCGVGGGAFVQLGGILSLLLGGSILAVAGVWRIRATILSYSSN